jgi:hypothetical protein
LTKPSKKLDSNKLRGNENKAGKGDRRDIETKRAFQAAACEAVRGASLHAACMSERSPE